jgi:hypothetical protein
VCLLLLAAPALGAQSLTGVWKSQGYGYVFRIDDRALSAWEITATTCVTSFEASRDTATVPGREATFVTKGGNTFFVRTGGAADPTSSSSVILRLP